jgi:hypothetical protein
MKRIIPNHFLFLAVIYMQASFSSGRAQDPPDFEFDGYLSNMQTVMFEKWDQNWWTENQIHNRLNFEYHITSNLSFDLEVRNRFIYGDFVKTIPGYDRLIDSETGWVDMSWLLANKPSFLIHTTIDRLYLDYMVGKFQFRAGRQRINWGQSLVWNPNDVFNAYSYFDFDYVEKPGSDAMRVQYYTGVSSVLDVSAKIDSSRKVTAAARYQFSLFNYDIQFMGGLFQDDDLILGAGWSGNIKGAAFRGELTWFHSTDNAHKEEVMLTVSGDYTFPNSLYIGLEYLFSNIEYGDFSFGEYYFMPMNVKNIAFTDHSIFAQVSYPFTPLFTGQLAGMYFPSERGFYIGPSFDLSVLDNLTLSFIFQHFQGRFGGDATSKTTLGFLRLKWNF